MIGWVLRWLGGARYDAWRHRRLLQRARRYDAATMPENTFGKLVGRARPAEGRVLLEAPLSGRLCIYYDVVVVEMQGDHVLRTIGTEQDGIAFVIADETGAARVDPVDAYVSSTFDHVEQSTTETLDDRQRALLARLRIRPHLLAGNALQYREALIEIDERIAVFGGGVRDLDGGPIDGMYRDGRATRLCLTGTAQFPLFISDDPKAL